METGSERLRDFLAVTPHIKVGLHPSLSGPKFMFFLLDGTAHLMIKKPMDYGAPSLCQAQTSVHLYRADSESAQCPFPESFLSHSRQNGNAMGMREHEGGWVWNPNRPPS